MFRVVWPDGRVVWIGGWAEVVAGASGGPTRLRGAVMDTTARLEAEEALREHKDRLATIIETEPACVKTVDRQGRLVQMNKAGLAMLEVSSLAEAQEYTLVDYLVHEHRRLFGE